jgi:hypothetical protein
MEKPIDREIVDPSRDRRLHSAPENGNAGQGCNPAGVESELATNALEVSPILCRACGRVKRDDDLEPPDGGFVLDVIWNDGRLRSHGTAAVLLACYLTDNRHGNALGLYRVPKAYILADLPLTGEELDAALTALQGIGFVDYRGEWAFVRDHAARTILGGSARIHPGDKRQGALRRLLALCAEDGLRAAALAAYGDSLRLAADAPCDAPLYAPLEGASMPPSRGLLESPSHTLPLGDLDLKTLPDTGKDHPVSRPSGAADGALRLDEPPIDADLEPAGKPAAVPGAGDGFADQVYRAYVAALPGHPKLLGWGALKAKLGTRKREGVSLADFERAFTLAAGDAFLTGKTREGYVVPFAWFVKNADNVQRVLGGDFGPNRQRGNVAAFPPRGDAASQRRAEARSTMRERNRESVLAADAARGGPIVLEG